MIIPPEKMITKHLHPDDIEILDELERSEKTIFRTKSSFNGEITVVENELGRFLKFDNSYQAARLDHPLYKGSVPYVNYFFLAAAMKADIKKVLVLGLGTGYFIKQLKTLIPQIEKVDVVDINPELIEIAEKYFDFDKADININIQDGRVFVRNSSEKYDLIVLDVFSETGMEYRFMTREFLDEISNILSSDGILVSNVFGLTDMNSQNNTIFKSLLKTYKTVFEDNVIFPTNYGNYELYKLLIGLKHHLSDLTNIILFSSKEEISISTSKVLQIMDKLKINLDKYVQDFYFDDVNLENVHIFTDKDEHLVKN